MCLTDSKRYASLPSSCRDTIGGGYDKPNGLWHANASEEVEEQTTAEEPPLPSPPIRVIAGWSFMCATILITCGHSFELTHPLSVPL